MLIWTLGVATMRCKRATMVPETRADRLCKATSLCLLAEGRMRDFWVLMVFFVKNDDAADRDARLLVYVRVE